MSRKQSQLRQMMKLEREKKSVSSDIHGKQDPPKSILKSKSSYAGKSTSVEGVDVHGFKVEIMKKKRAKRASKVKKVSVDTAKVNFEAIEKEVSKEANEGTEQEFEDFLNSVDDIGVNEVEDDVKAPTAQVEPKSEPNMANEENKNIEEIDTIEDKSKQNEQEMEMEQTAYEARLAKLMLLSRKRKSDEVDKTVIDFTPQLAFQDISTTNGLHLGTSKDDLKTLQESEKDDAKGKTKKSSSTSMKDLLRKKRSKKARISADHGDIEEESFWS